MAKPSGDSLSKPTHPELNNMPNENTVENPSDGSDDVGERLKRAIRDYVAGHPYASAFQVVSAFAFFAPGLIAIPFLSAVGFGAAGPTAGSIAAAYQSANGATRVFSTLQSAAMGGYGTAAVNGAVQGISLAATTVAQLSKRRDPPPTDDEIESDDGNDDDAGPSKESTQHRDDGEDVDDEDDDDYEDIKPITMADKSTSSDGSDDDVLPIGLLKDFTLHKIGDSEVSSMNEFIPREGTIKDDVK